jgi:hypothetical protein
VTLSLLLPTSIIGTGADGAEEDNGDPGYEGDDAEDSLTRCIWLWNLVIRVKDDLDEML